MRKKHTFLLTIFPSEDQQPALCGRLQLINTGATYTFTNLIELQQFIEKGINLDGTSVALSSIQEGKASYQMHSDAYPEHCEEEL
jgi:hypothetical protein